jgi:hypothetical protein
MGGAGYLGIFKVLPSRMKSEDIPLAALILDTVVPFF